MPVLTIFFPNVLFVKCETYISFSEQTFFPQNSPVDAMLFLPIFVFCLLLWALCCFRYCSFSVNVVCSNIVCSKICARANFDFAVTMMKVVHNVFAFLCLRLMSLTVVCWSSKDLEAL